MYVSIAKYTKNNEPRRSGVMLRINLLALFLFDAPESLTIEILTLSNARENTNIQVQIILKTKLMM